MSQRPKLHLRPAHQLTGHRAAIYCLAPGRDDRHFLSAGGDGWLVDWSFDEPETGRLLASVDTRLFSLTFLPEQELAVAGNMNGGVHWIDLKNEDRRRNVLHHQKGVFAQFPLGEHLFTAGGDGLLTRWSIPQRRAMESLQLTSSSLRAIAFQPERNELAVGASDNAIYLLDADSLAIRRVIRDAHDNSVFCLGYHPHRPVLLSGGRDAHLKAWQLDGDPKLHSSQAAHWFTINALAFDPTGTYLATASRDKTVKLWSAEDLQLLKVLEGPRDKGHFNSVNTLLWSPEGDRLLSAGDDRSIIIWEVST